jgi:hypothetical protein
MKEGYGLLVIPQTLSYLSAKQREKRSSQLYLYALLLFLIQPMNSALRFFRSRGPWPTQRQLLATQNQQVAEAI